MNNLFAFQNLFDSHCHLNSSDFDTDVEQVVERAIAAGVEKVVDVGVDIPTSRKSVEYAKRYDAVVAAVGIDPQVAIPGHDEYEQRYTETAFADEKITELRKLIEENTEQIVAIGETGLDFYYDNLAVEKGELSREAADRSNAAQEYLFRQHLQLAVERDLPLSIHSRAAEPRALQIVKEYPNAKGVFHSFTGDPQTAKQILDAGWGLGVNGIITFKNAQELRDMYKSILGKVSSDWSPADFYKRGIYFETDAPYLAPEGQRGRRNEPANVAEIFNFLLHNF